MTMVVEIKIDHTYPLFVGPSNGPGNHTLGDDSDITAFWSAKVAGTFGPRRGAGPLRGYPANFKRKKKPLANHALYIPPGPYHSFSTDSQAGYWTPYIPNDEHQPHHEYPDTRYGTLTHGAGQTSNQFIGQLNGFGSFSGNHLGDGKGKSCVPQQPEVRNNKNITVSLTLDQYNQVQKMFHKSTTPTPSANIADLHTGQVKGIGKMVDELYHLRDDPVEIIREDVPIPSLNIPDVILAAFDSITLESPQVTEEALEPESYEEVMQHTECIATMDQELQALADNKTWTLTPLPTDKREIGCKWWNLKLTEALVPSGFHQSHYEYSLFIKNLDTDIALILVYVDDLIITDLIANFGLAGSKPASTPLEPNQRLTTVKFDQDSEGRIDNELLPGPRSYQKLGKKTMGRRKIPLVKIKKDVDRYSTFSKRRFGLYKKASKLVRENDVDLGIVLSSPAGNAYAFFHPTHNAVIDHFMNLKTDLGEQIVAENSLNKVNQPNDRLNDLDKRGEVAKEKFISLPQRNKTRDKGRWESIDQLNADDVMKFQAWLDVEEIMLKDQLPEASSSSQSPSEDADI
ncbi:putative C2 domain-containing protein-like [Capsicum annuum]|nr:putative C2 domain-containing protein-like [Capsicum annuum]